MRTLRCLVVASLLGSLGSACSRAESETATTDDAFLETVSERTFRWFWDESNPDNGLTPDRAPSRTFCSVAAVGFALTAYPIGVERGYISRAQAIERVLATLHFFSDSKQDDAAHGSTGYRGFYYHFLDMETGVRFAQVELSTIDTALLMNGVLFCQSYFDRADPGEAEIRELADTLYRRVEWDWAVRRESLISMGWRPERGFTQAAYEGYNEAMFLYVLALGSPTHPIEAKAWSDYTSTYTWGDFMGYEQVNFSPLFGHQYAAVWIDFRGIQDAFMREKGIDYFENSRRATYAQRAYAIANKDRWTGYGEDVWGLTACDGPANVVKEVHGEERRFHTYMARGASLRHVVDDGTLAPTAAGGSVAFAPEIVIPALRAMRERYGESLFSEYGFRDAFNPSFRFTDVEIERGEVLSDKGWFDSDYLGIDQGPILTMIENHRSGLIWKVMKRNPYIIRGLRRAGFTGGWLDEESSSREAGQP